MQKPTKKTIEDLNQIYEQTTTAAKELFAEQRSNALLVAGVHYSSKTSASWSRLRELGNVSSDQKLRLTKNHIQKITKAYINNLVSTSPSVKVIPRDEKSNQSRKSAELNNSVWQYAYDTQEIPMKVLNWASDYVEIGEVAVKVFWHPQKGEIVSYNQAVGADGQPQFDENGQPKQGSPNYSGELAIEHILATNLGMDINCTSFDESPWIWVRKMMPYEKVKELVGNDPDKLKMIAEDKKDPTMVFDPAVAEYTTVKGQVLIIEYYFRPCAQYPQGYYFITTKQGILFEGELPFGIFPIEYVGFDRIQANPRHRSIIKQLRPYQLEINRTASKIAEHQITSDDKLLIQNGTKLGSGSHLAGIRVLNYSGNKPEFLEGRSGAQYVDYMQAQITEMYQVAGVSEDMEYKEPKGNEPMGLLFRSVKDQKKFSMYAEKFEHFLKRVCKLYLKLAKEYFDEETLVPMVGKSEFVNIAEFKNTRDIDTNIKVVPMTDDINTMFGKWMSINHMIQFSSTQLGKEDIARIARNLPFGNFEESFKDLTLDYDLADNFILAIDRGEQPQPGLNDNKEYMAKRLSNRMRQPDFPMLPPEIQQYYQMALNQYQQMLAQDKAELQRAESGFIPTTGPLIRTDLKAEVPNASGGMKTVSKSFPIDALAWLEKQMQAQGASVETLMQLSEEQKAQIAAKFNGMNPQAGLPQVPTSGGSPQQNQGSQMVKHPSQIGQQTPQQALNINVAAQPQGANSGAGSTNLFPRNAK